MQWWKQQWSSYLKTQRQFDSWHHTVYLLLFLFGGWLYDSRVFGFVGLCLNLHKANKKTNRHSPFITTNKHTTKQRNKTMQNKTNKQPNNQTGKQTKQNKRNKPTQNRTKKARENKTKQDREDKTNSTQQNKNKTKQRNKETILKHEQQQPTTICLKENGKTTINNQQPTVFIEKSQQPTTMGLFLPPPFVLKGWVCWAVVVSVPWSWWKKPRRATCTSVPRGRGWIPRGKTRGDPVPQNGWWK